ncbi:MAG: hypothetical protein J6R71_00905, partial [Bacteroidales bacterium]|nr:hypothetical protein [Bacteroidales bacterium]
MKNLQKYIYLIVCLFCLTACPTPPPEPEDRLPQTQDRFFVLCEGLFNLNNGTLAYWNKDRWISK